MLSRISASRRVWLVALGVAIWIVAAPWILAVVTTPRGVLGLVGADLGIYLEATRTWVASGHWYLARQLDGPYGIEYGDVLYPPLLLYLTVPFLVIPEPVWYVVPLCGLAWGIWRLRPSRWAWPVMILCLATPLTFQQLLKGNPVIWIVGMEATFLARGWPLTLVILKPSLVPFAIVGIHRRVWWALLAAIAIACIPVASLVFQYPQVILDSRGGGILYSVRDVPLLFIPILAALHPISVPDDGSGTATGVRPFERWLRTASEHLGIVDSAKRGQQERRDHLPGSSRR